jgi:hypothetical protein
MGYYRDIARPLEVKSQFFSVAEGSVLVYFETFVTSPGLCISTILIQR